MGLKYTEKEYKKDHDARALGRAIGISTKHSIEIANNIRKKSVAKAKTILNEVIKLKKPVPYTRFTNGAGHKRGIGAGKYPVNAAKGILRIIEAVEANAQFKGLNTSDLQIKRIIIQNAGNVFRYGRHRRRRMKRTHVEILVEEGKAVKKKDPLKVQKVDGKKSDVPKAIEKKISDQKIEDVKTQVKTPEKSETKVEKVAKPKSIPPQVDGKNEISQVKKNIQKENSETKNELKVNNKSANDKSKLVKNEDPKNKSQKSGENK